MTLRSSASALRRDASGIAMTEFAIAFPIILALGMYGIETAHYALTHLKLNQIALNLADNASRVGSNSSLSSQAMREIDVEDVFAAARSRGKSIDLETRGRVILSSLEKDDSGTQRLHWQRCFGSKTGDTYESHYGKVRNVDGSDKTFSDYVGQEAPNGMGETGAKVNAPTAKTGVMFVEVNYQYIPLFGWLSSPSNLRYSASFIVRDPRDFAQIYHSADNIPAPSYCNYAEKAEPT